MALFSFSFFLFHGHAQPLEAERKGEGKGGGVRVKDYEGSRERWDQGERGDRRNFSLTQMSDKGIVAARLGGRHRAKHVRISIFFYRGRKDDIYIYIYGREKEIALAPLVDNISCVSSVRFRIENRCLTFLFFLRILERWNFEKGEEGEGRMVLFNSF